MKLSSVMALAKRFAREDGGVVAIVFALALLPMAGTVGAAVDYSRLSNMRTELQTIADSAVLAAVGLRNDTRAPTQGERRDEAARIFRNQLKPDQLAALQSAHVHVEETNEAIRARVRFVGNVPLLFGAILGREAKTIEGEAHAEVIKATTPEPTPQLLSFNDVFILMDASSSMWLPADTAGRDRLIELTGCAFACHEPRFGLPRSFLDIAREEGLTLRTDVMLRAAARLIEQLGSAQRTPGQNRAAVVQFDEGATVHARLTDDLAAARAALDRLRPGYLTWMDTGLSQLNAMIDRQGDGSSNLSSFKWALIVTDGIFTKSRYNTVPFDDNLCRPLHDKGTKVIVIRLEYLELPGSGDWERDIKPIMPAVRANMQRCASPGLYFEADQTAEIEAAFAKAFAAVQAASAPGPATASRGPRLTR